MSFALQPEAPLTSPAPSPAGDTAPRETISAAAFTWAVRLLLAYFGARLVFFALTVSSFVPPDEVTHAGLCDVFASVFLLPENGPDTYEFGLVTNTPWLYYWIYGKLLHLNVFGMPDLIFLRLLNIPLAFGTIHFVRRTLSLFTADRLTHLLLLVALTNTPMFSFLAASVSYDNLTTLWAAAAIYSLCAFLKGGSGDLLVLSLLAQLAGCLTKITFLPLVLILNLVLLVAAARQFSRVPRAVAGYLRGSGLRSRVLMALMVPALLLNLQLHGGNYLRFGSFTPSMETVVSAEAATRNRIGARENIFRLYTEGKLTYLDALQKAGEIDHPGDKADTFFLLMNYENLKHNPALWLGPAGYAKVWLMTVVDTVFGIKGHKGMFKPWEYLIPLHALLVFALVGFAVRWRPREGEWLSPVLGAVALCYGAFLMLKVNYTSYLYYGTPGPTLQGRYLFPVLGCAYIFCAYHLLRLFRAPALRLALAAGVALLFIAYDFPWFLTHSGEGWYSWPPM